MSYQDSWGDDTDGWGSNGGQESFSGSNTGGYQQQPQQGQESNGFGGQQPQQPTFQQQQQQQQSHQQQSHQQQGYVQQAPGQGGNQPQQWGQQPVQQQSFQQPVQQEQQQPWIPQQNAAPQQQVGAGHTSGGGPFGAISSGNPADFLNNVASNTVLQQAGLQYGANMAASGKDYVSSQVNKYVPVSELQKYFQVTTYSVARKLRLLLFPFLNRDWERKMTANDQGRMVGLGPRDDVNAPDLYIPVMAFVTYVLVYGLALGILDQFSPERLGMTASSAAAWYIFEFLLLFLGSYLLNLTTLVSYLDILSFVGYKYVSANVSLVFFIVLGSNAFWPLYLYTTTALGFFLYKTLQLQMLPEQSADPAASGSKKTYFLAAVALSQFLFVYVLTLALNKLPSPTTD